MPVIAPPLNATLSALWMPDLAASVVLTLARTETNIPMKPVRPEKTAPTRKPTAVIQPRVAKSATNMRTPTTAMMVYWRFM